MVQALEKGNISPKLRKMGFLHKKRVIFSQNSDFDEILFSQKSLINRKKQTTYPSTTSPGGTNLYNILLLLQAPAKLKFWRKGRAATGAHLSKMKAQYQTFQTRYSSFLWYA